MNDYLHNPKVVVRESSERVEITVTAIFRGPRGAWSAYVDRRRDKVQLHQPLGVRELTFGAAPNF